ncbi:MAG: hypothetical protein KDC66_02955 [Phaeodactylibacter sp.]|nr:hypothetical protein [Phaeodactylibacter sp.]MCB9272846.1 hypothetical protein [Lewinellaceae bacterium]
MKSFFQAGTATDYDALAITRSEKVIELEFPGHEGSLFTYLLPKSDTTAWAVACWGDTLDFLLDMNPREITDNWPFMASLMDAGSNKVYENGALVRIQAPDNDEMRWGIMTEVSDMDVQKNAANLWGFPQLLKAIEVVHQASAKMYKELKDNQPKGWEQAQKALLERCEGAEESLFFDFGFLQNS